MGEYVGSQTFVSLQKALRDRAGEFASNPLIANGGRIMNILDPDAFGWDNVRRVAERDKFVGLTSVARDETLDRLRQEFEGTAEFPYWQVFAGAPEQVLPACARVLDTVSLPADWRLDSQTHPDDHTIDLAQSLNTEAGVAPVPAYYMRGDALPSMLTCLYDQDGTMVGCASGTMRYHPDSKLSGWMFAGGVSVHPDHRRKKLGTCLNAALLRDSQAAFGWTSVLEQAKADNLASVGMISACGLCAQDDKVTIVVNLTGGYITR